MIIELKGNEANITSTKSTFNNASCIKIIVTSGNPVITLRDSSNNQIGNTTLDTGIHFVKKHPTETIEATTNVLGTAVAFTIG